MVNTIKGIKINIPKNKGLIVVVLLVLSLLIPSIITPPYTEAIKKNDVLKIVSKSQPQISVPAIIITPTPTISIPTLTPVPTGEVLSPTPTVTPTPTSISAVTPTSTPAPQAVDTPTPTPTLTPSPIPTETPTPTPAGLKIQIGIDYGGGKNDSYTTTVSQGQTAWDAVSATVGLSNLKYTDYGKDMGIFITGFNGINADSSHYFEFKVNGVSSNTGVSNYKCNDGDKLDFVLTSFSI